MYNAFVTIVRALLVFGADTTVENNCKQTPWILAMKQMQDSGLLDAISIGVSLKDNRRAVLYSLFSVGCHGSLEMPPLDAKGVLQAAKCAGLGSAYVAIEVLVRIDRSYSFVYTRKRNGL